MRIIQFFLIYGDACKISYDAKSLRNIFDNVNEYTRKYDKAKYLGLFHSN